MIGFYNYTVVLTYFGVAAGLLGVFAAAHGDVRAAVVCLMLAGGCDLFDGRVARTRQRTDQEKRFGIQIDSLADLISFGVLPAMIGFCLGLERWNAILLCCYVLCALIRLAYYNVTEDELQIPSAKPRTHYDGLPVTTAALIFPLVYALRPLLSNACTAVYAVTMAAVAVAFIARVRIKKLGLTGTVIAAVAGLAVLVAVLLGD